ncbi:MAG: quinolinate synthase NadA [Deltaproteobacteria bacterium]|nr:quinolinate synthase NadA [Deltaproteobacteria bacterium]
MSANDTLLQKTTEESLPEDLFAAIEKLKREREAVILAHYYQDADIQDLADTIGDSLVLARAAQKSSAKVIVFCGVHFMAETAKILSPDKKVILPDVNAGCSLAQGCPKEEFVKFKAEHKGHVVVSYINTTAAIKALSDYVCTSGNAKAVIEAIPKEQPIIFGPDKNLGRYLSEQTGRKMVLWPGTCVVHETFNERRVLELLEQNPGAELIAHPECEEPVLRHAHYIGSTKAMLDYTQKSPVQTFIVATEIGILHQMRKASPSKNFIVAAPATLTEASCGCSTCEYMKLNTLEKLYLCLRDMRPEIELAPELIAAAQKPIKRMVAIG